MTPWPHAPSTFEGHVVVRLGAAELWDLLWRPRGQPLWLGPNASVRLRRDSRSVLVDEAGPWRVARCRGTHPHSRATFDVEPGDRWKGGSPTEVTIAVEEVDEGARLTITETGVEPPDHRDVTRYWTERLRLVDALARRVRKRRAKVRQAVVVIHGIGEQQPGATLAALVASDALSAKPATDELNVEQRLEAWVKPDRRSDSFELRRYTLPGVGVRPTTDAYELYWAHMIRDTTLGQVGAWVGRLLLRWPVPRPLLPQWLFAWAVIVIAVVALVLVPVAPAVGAGVGLAAIAAGTARLVWRTVGRSLATNVVGDAARYLRPRPENIAQRQAIRQAGVDLLRRLHLSEAYDRIVVVGHSLGSVIAYDVLTQLWIEMNRNHERPTRPSFKALRAVERAIGGGNLNAVSAQQLQHKAWQQLRANTQPWLVTDLVTLGSPLTYADFLLTEDREMLERAKRDRVLPTCPPETELEHGSGHERITYDGPYTDTAGGRHRPTFSTLHHAAPFAVTRWTNLWFKHELLGLTGDLVGGPVAPQFGAWVRDIEMESPWRSFSHTRYWTPSADGDEHLRQLRDAIGLDVGGALFHACQRIPAYVFTPARRSHGSDHG